MRQDSDQEIQRYVYLRLDSPPNFGNSAALGVGAERPRQCLNGRDNVSTLVRVEAVSSHKLELGRLARVGRQFSFLGVLQGVGGFRGMFVADLGGEVAMGLRR